MSVEPRLSFPEIPIRGDLGDVVALGGELTMENLREAYSKGIFPWPHEGYPMLWFSPERRGVLFLEELYISRTNKKSLLRNPFEFSANQAFDRVIFECQKQTRPGQQGTWITPEVSKAYIEFHHESYAHSIEVWEGRELVGGLYGVFCEGLFSAESMFFKKTNASKLGFIKLALFLKDKGFSFIDVQMVTEVSESFGAKYIGRSEFYLNLDQQKKRLGLRRWDNLEFAREFKNFNLNFRA